ncbi:WD domain protein [Vermiconidia calcicola]|uniref:WD domain protein n=1 Tax=Vermiconidia calcicola TaxID=1690605 RepID=A0ACC3MJ74_9PEZI|nr:WD domain protein [Vermiconidia calcicola]
MSNQTSPDPPDRGSPKRKRSPSRDSDQPRYDGARDSKLRYAYDEEELPSDAEQAFPSPDQEQDGLSPKRRKVERPRRLNYIPYMTLRGHKRGVAAVKFSPDGKWIASCSADATIKIWDAQTGGLAQTLEGHLAGISTIAWSPDSKVLASGSDDKLIRLWDISTGKCMPTPLVGHHNYVYSLAFSPKGNMLVSGSYDEAVFLWDVRTARLMRSLPAHSDPVRSVDFVRDGTLTASCSSDGLIRIWDTGTGQCLKTLVHEDNAAVTSVKFSPNGKFVLAATLDNAVRLWNYVEGRCAKTYQGHKNEKFSINACFGTYTADPTITEDGAEGDGEGQPGQQKWAFVACGSEDGSTVLWDVSSKEILQTLPSHEGVVLGVDVGLEDQTILTCGMDKTIKIWKRQPVATNGHDRPLLDQNGSSIE